MTGPDSRVARPALVALAVAVFALVAVAALAFGAGAAGPGAERVLVVERVDTGERVVEVPVEEGTTVALEYTHSVEKSRVYDGYAVRGERLEMTRMEFESYGWGLPAGANVTRVNGTLVYDPEGSVEVLYVSPGEIAGHRLHVDGRTYDLVARSDARSVRIHVERRSTLERLLGRLAGDGGDSGPDEVATGARTSIAESDGDTIP